MPNWNFPKLVEGAALGSINSAAYHNAIRDALRWVAAQMNSGQKNPRRLAQPDGTIFIKNTTGGGAPRWSVLGIDDSIIDPAAHGDLFAAQFPMKGVTPTADHAGRFCVLQEDIPDGEIGVGMVSGVTPCQIGGTRGAIPGLKTLGWADVDPGNNNLRWRKSGAAQVLWTSDTAANWAVIRLGNVAAPNWWHGTLLSTLNPTDSSCQVYLKLADGSNCPGGPFLCQNDVGLRGAPEAKCLVGLNDQTSSGYPLMLLACDPGLVLQTHATDVGYDTGSWTKKTRPEWIQPNDVESGWMSYVTGTQAGGDEQRDSTSISLSVDSGYITYGTTTTLTASVTHSGGSGDPTGRVVFSAGNLFLGSVILSGGSATLTTSLPVGSYTITATYGGDGTYDGSTSTASLTVTKADVSVTLANTPSSTTYGDYVTMSVTINTSMSNPALAAPRGNVQFFDGTTLLAMVDVHPDLSHGSGHPASSTASFGTQFLQSGTRTLKAVYAGDANYNTANQTQSQAVAKAVLTGHIQDAFRQYGDGNPTWQIRWDGFKNFDTEGVIRGTPDYTCSANNTSNVDTYPVTATTGTCAADNYTFQFVDGRLYVRAVPLQIVGSSVTMVKGDSLPAFTGTVSGIRNGDNLTYHGTTSASSSSPPGDYVITAGVNDPDGKLRNYYQTVSNSVLTITAPGV